MQDISAIKLNSPEVSNSAFSVWERFREGGGITWSDRHKAWVVSNFALIREVLLNEDSSVEKLAPFTAHSEGQLKHQAQRMQAVMAHWLPFLDPPAHTRMRRILQRSFTPRSLGQHEAPIRQIARDILDELAGKAEIEFLDDFAAELPARAIAYLYGIPQSETPMLRRWADGIAEFVLGSDKPERYETSLSIMEEMESYFEEMVDRTSREGGVAEGPLMQLLLAARDEEDGLTDKEVVATLILILFAAPETTANMLVNGMYSLVRWPEQLKLLQEGPAGIPRAIEELIRYDGPAPVVVRVAGRDMEIGSQRITEGQRIFLLLKSGNRDEAQFDRPDQLVIERDRSPHLAFGSGIHMCLGAPLARLEARITFEEFIGRYRSISMPEQEIEWRSELLAHSPKSLYLQVEPRE